MQLLRKFLASIRTKGFVATTKVVANYLADRVHHQMGLAFDRKHGTDTSGIVPLKQLNIVGGNKESGLRYEPTTPVVFRHIMNRLRLDMSLHEFIFIDYGSGKGRALLLASEYDFKSIIGLEFAMELHITAEKNIRAYRSHSQACKTITSVNTDVTQFTPPPGNLLAYFFNPFQSKVLNAVLSNMRSSLDSDPAKLALVDLYPMNSDMIERCGIFKRCIEIEFPRDYIRNTQGACKVYFNW